MRTRDGLTQKTAAALVWTYAGATVRMVLSLVIGVALARLLGPGPFGVAAIAALVLGLGSLLGELGLGPALVQREEVCPRAIRFVFTVQVAIGVFLAAVTYVSSTVIAAGFGLPEAGAVIRGVAPIFVIQALGTVGATLLRREMRLKALQVVEVASYVAGYCGVGLPMALRGGGVWSLVAAQLVQAAVMSAACYALTRHTVLPAIRPPDALLGRFGRQVLRTNLANWLIGNIDNGAVGRAFPVVQLGLYSRVYSLLFAPVAAVVSSLQRVLFPAFSRTQDDRPRMARAYLAAVAVVALVTIPAYGCAALVAPAVVRGLFGEGWDGAATLVVPLALAMPLHALMALGGPVLWAADRVGDEARVQIFTAVVCVAGCCGAAFVAVPCVAWVVLAVYAMRCLLVTDAVINASGLGWKDVLAASRGGLMVLAVIGPAVFAVDAMSSATMGAAARLLLDTATGVVLAGGLVLVAPRQILGAALGQYVARFAGRGPAPVRLWVARAGAAGGVS